MALVAFSLSSADIDVKAAGKFLGGRFACGASVTGEDEIVIQGDFVDDLFDVLPEKWPQVLLYRQCRAHSMGVLINACDELASNIEKNKK